MARLFVAVATLGRAELARRTIDLLSEQTRPPDGVVVVGAHADDIAGIERARGSVKAIIAPKGLCNQRNAALDQVGSAADIITFLDDDFLLAPDYLETVERLFAKQSDLVGMTGTVLKDGARGDKLSFDEAVAMLSRPLSARGLTDATRQALYGCNMSFRRSAIGGQRFDERLPLYGWQEDIDFSYRVGRSGRMIASKDLLGIHLGSRSGRTPGKRLGYSQVANIVYLHRKGTMPKGLGWRLLRQNLLANLLRSVRPEPGIDRRGRLAGNLLAIGDVLRGRVEPERVLML
jgi:GT2 family glycosyltransferase